MGLLIGGSAITVVEFLDLVVYTLLRKCVEKRKGKRQTRPTYEGVDEKKEEVSTSSPETLTSVENFDHGLDFRFNDDYNK